MHVRALMVIFPILCILLSCYLHHSSCYSYILTFEHFVYISHVIDETLFIFVFFLQTIISLFLLIPYRLPLYLIVLVHENGLVTLFGTFTDVFIMCPDTFISPSYFFPFDIFAQNNRYFVLLFIMKSQHVYS